VASGLIIPSYQNGFAPRDGLPMYSGLRKGLVGLWQASLGFAGAALYDQSGRGRDGVIENMTAAQAWVSTIHGPGLQFAEDKSGLMVTGGVPDQAVGSFACWYKRTASIADYGGIFNVETPGNNSPHELVLGANNPGTGFWPNYDQTGGRYWRFWATEKAAGWNANFALNRWYHVAVTWDNNAQAIRGYLDGVLTGAEQGSGAWTASAWVNGENTYLGRTFIASMPLNCEGVVPGFALWARAIVPHEVRTLYEDPHALVRPMPRTVWPSVVPYWIWSRQQQAQVIGGGVL